MKNRNSSMGGSEKEKNALRELEKLRIDYIERCNYQNEKNWVASVACMNRISLSKILFYKEIIDKVTDIPGCILELGIQWGATTSLLYNLTSIQEPFNFRRKIVGFDTFEGFPSSSINELEKSLGWKKNALSTDSNVQAMIENSLELHQNFSAMPHMKKYELVKGDVIETLPKWFESNPCETVALCIFDMDLGIPTKKALEEILKHTQKGSILVFDEYSHPLFPDEGRVARELLEANKFKFEKSIFLPYQAYVVL